MSQFLFGCASRRTRGRFRGIRHSVVWDASEMFSRGRTNSPKGQMADATWRAGFARLAPLNLTFEGWLYHPQLMELADLARAFPQTTIILNHVGGPLGIGPYADKKEETFAAWKAGVAELGRLLPALGYRTIIENGEPVFIVAPRRRASVEGLAPNRERLADGHPFAKLKEHKFA